MREADGPGSLPNSADIDRSATLSASSPVGRASSSSTLSRPYRSACSRLPYELLHAIFLLAAVPSDTRPPHGGSVHSWCSFEPAAAFSLVCKSWRSPAQAVLFSSVSLIGHRPASLFVRTVQAPTSSHLAKKTAFLVLGLDPHVEASRDSSLRQRETSELLIQALEACPSAVHLHVRPLSHEIRHRLLAAAFDPKRGVRSIIISPRVLTSLPWSGNLWLAEDATNPIPSLENLEITTFVKPAERPLTPKYFPPLALRRIKVHADYPMEVLVHALRQSSQLEFVDLYFELHKPLEEMLEALKPSVGATVEMRYICNLTHYELLALDATSSASLPPTLFDTLLPLYTKLTYLRVSATDISPLALRFLPPTFRKLHVRVLSVHSRFTCVGLLNLLRTSSGGGSSLAFPEAFEDLVVVDSPDHWPIDQLDEIERLLEERGVRFVFKLDFEEEGETTTESGSGRTRRSSLDTGTQRTRDAGTDAGEEGVAKLAQVQR
ncbi:hypothetical protein JCM11251_006219 [Rhodosporidiobolus azoricus]